MSSLEERAVYDLVCFALTKGKRNLPKQRQEVLNYLLVLFNYTLAKLISIFISIFI